jgi:hypothetical protein
MTGTQQKNSHLAVPWIEEQEPRHWVSFRFDDERAISLRYDRLRFMQMTEGKIVLAFEDGTLTVLGHALEALEERLCEQRVVSIHEQRLALVQQGGDAPFIRRIAVGPRLERFA